MVMKFTEQEFRVLVAMRDEMRELLDERVSELALRLVAPGAFPQISASEGHELSEAIVSMCGALERGSLSREIAPSPVPMLLWCPKCGERHIDVGEFATKVHHTHACQNCGLCWRPAVVPTCGVQFLPGFKNP